MHVGPKNIFSRLSRNVPELLENINIYVSSDLEVIRRLLRTSDCMDIVAIISKRLNSQIF